MKLHPNKKIPAVYTAGVLSAFGEKIECVQKVVPFVKKGEVLVRIKAAPINPSDMALVAGRYPIPKDLPFVPGLEGAGEVVASGGGFMADFMLGKRVACSPTENGDGTWAEFMVVPAGRCIPLKKDIDFVKGSSALVNPLTAIALVKIAQKRGHALVNTAAGGALGKMILQLAQKKNLAVINIVRKPEQAKQLTDLGAKIVLDLSDKNFTQNYREACRKHNAQTILDAISGPFSGKLLAGAPTGAQLLNYASLSGEPLKIESQYLLRERKTVAGFHLGTWLANQPVHRKFLLTQKAQKLMASDVFKTPVAQTFSLGEINDALKKYAENMSAGKWILTF